NARNGPLLETPSDVARRHRRVDVITVSHNTAPCSGRRLIRKSMPGTRRRFRASGTIHEDLIEVDVSQA
ncbi:hypothetical protein, partial [Mesorhizobium sp.]|uniref:hypothetical protein n=1 Tax=Mesorhizobium sp. TaxID=1871066 RepID=UPI0025BC15D6